MRSKEFANDYRYFPEPDLPPLRVPPDLVEKVKTEMPELPDARRARYISEFGLTAYEAGVIIDEREVADYFEATLPSLKNLQGRSEMGHDGSSARGAREWQIDRRGCSASGGSSRRVVEDGRG